MKIRERPAMCGQRAVGKLYVKKTECRRNDSFIYEIWAINNKFRFKKEFKIV